MDDSTANLLRAAFDAYIARMKVDGLEPSDNYLRYDFETIDAVQWRLLGNEMVKDELRELTNCLNHWHGSLHRWQAWNSVISTYGQDEAWAVRREFFEDLAHYCLLQPSAMRDTFTFVVTNSMHQVRLASSISYRDHLEGDPTTAGEQHRHLTRKKKEKRLSDLISNFPSARQFMKLLRNLDDEAYRQQTYDYRNLSSHSIGPRLGIGITRAVVRNVAQATELIKQPDGTFISAPIPGRVRVSYGFGGTAPLNIEKALAANLEQYRRARKCYAEYRAMLAIGLAAMLPVRPAA
jgi:hypothetical protein